MLGGAVQVEVVTVWAPRPTLPQYRDYTKLMLLQRATARKFGHLHTVVTDCPHLVGFDTLRIPLPSNLMQAQLAGQLAFLQSWDDKHPVVFLDADCLVARDLSEAFDGSFDVGLTNRIDETAPINNGAMYLAAGSKQAALAFFGKALDMCAEHWGGDQEAISRAAAPVPPKPCVEDRDGVRFGFLSMLTHNVIPKLEGAKHHNNPFVVHFKGTNKKDWASTYARKFILN
jgi:hypothetical protein